MTLLMRDQQEFLRGTGVRFRKSANEFNPHWAELKDGYYVKVTGDNAGQVFYDGVLQDMTNDLTDAAKRLLHNLGLLRDGNATQLVFHEIRGAARRIRAISPRSTVNAFTSVFRFNLVRYAGKMFEDLDGEWIMKYPPQIEKREEQGRFRRIIPLIDDGIVIVDQLQGPTDAGMSELVIRHRLAEIQKKHGTAWGVIETHNDQIVYANRNELVEYLRGTLDERVVASMEHDIQTRGNGDILKYSFLKKIVQILLTDGSMGEPCGMKVDVSGNPVMWDSPIDGCDVLTQTQMNQVCKMKGLPLTSILQVRGMEIPFKGTYMLENKYVKAGHYPESWSCQDVDGELVLPNEINLDDIMVIDSSAATSGKTEVMMPLQAIHYIRDKKFQRWIVAQIIRYIRKLVRGDEMRWFFDNTHRMLVPIGRWDLIMDSGLKSKNHALGFVNMSNALIGDRYRPNDREDDDGYVDTLGVKMVDSQKRGCIRGLPINGMTAYLQAGVGIEDNEVVLSQQVAEGLNIEIGDICHVLRWPSLCHGGVMMRLKVKDIVYQPGDFMTLSWNTIQAMTGDVDGDRAFVTTYFVGYEKKYGEINLPRIMPEEYQPAKKNPGSWTDHDLRIKMSSIRQPISDMSWRRAMDIIHGYVNPNCVANEMYQEFDEDEVRLAGAGHTQAQVMMKKWFVDMPGTLWELGPADGLFPIDMYHECERLLAAGCRTTTMHAKGPFHHPVVGLVDGERIVERAIDVYDELRAWYPGYIFTGILKAIKSAFDKLIDIPRKCGYGDGGTVRFRSTKNWRDREKRISRLVDYIPEEMLIKITGRNKKGRVVPTKEAPIVRVVGNKLSAARRVLVRDKRGWIKNGEAVRLHVLKGRKEGEVELRTKMKERFTLNGVYRNADEVEILESTSVHERITVCCKSIRMWLGEKAKDLDAVFGGRMDVSVFDGMFADSEDFIHYVMDMFVLHRVNNENSDAYWTFALNIVEERVIFDLLCEDSYLS